MFKAIRPRYDGRSGLLERRAERLRQLCAGNLPRDELPRSSEDIDWAYGQSDDHMKFEGMAAAASKPAEVIPLSAIIYLINNGESLLSKKNDETCRSMAIRNLAWPARARALLRGSFSNSERSTAGFGSTGTFAMAVSFFRQALGKLRPVKRAPTRRS